MGPQSPCVKSPHDAPTMIECSPHLLHAMTEGTNPSNEHGAHTRIFQIPRASLFGSSLVRVILDMGHDSNEMHSYRIP